MSNYSFSAVRWGGQSASGVTTGHIQADAGSGKRPEANRNRAKGGNTAQPLQGKTHTTTDFETVNNFVAAVQSGDSVAASALLVYGSSAVSRAVATGRLASGR
jgi:hypothetical protein